MNVFNEVDMRKKLDEDLVYMENIDNDLSEDEVINFFIECLDYCNKLSLYDYKEKIKEKIYELGYKDDIRLELGLNNPYLYIDNDDYTNEYYFVGNFNKYLINENKEFSYRFQYDKYIRNGIYFEFNKHDVDYVIRNYKNILLNTTNKELNKLCLDKIYEIYEKNSFTDILEKEDIEIIEYGKEDTEEDLISVILTNYNNDDYIEDTIKSICNQTYKNIEFIIGDNHSKNLTMQTYKDILNKYKSDNIKKLIIYRSKINLGLVSNQNKAISLANGKFIKFISGDDMFYDKYVLENMHNYIKENNYELITSKLEWNDINMNRLPQYDVDFPPTEEIYRQNGEILSDSESFKKEVFERGFFCMADVFLHKNVFEKYGLFDENYFLYDDYPYCLKLAIKECIVGYIDIFSIKYRTGSGVSTRINKDKSIINDGIRFRSYKDYLKNMNIRGIL